MSCSHKCRVSTAPCWQESRVWFILPLPVYNPSKSMNQHRGSGGVRESTGAELLPTPISSVEHASQGWSFGFPPPEPQCSYKKTSRGPCEHAAHVSQCSGSSLALGAPPGPQWDTARCPDPWGQTRQSLTPGHSPILPWHEITPGLLHSTSLAQAQLLFPCLWLLQVSGPLAVPQPRATSAGRPLAH